MAVTRISGAVGGLALFLCACPSMDKEAVQANGDAASTSETGGLEPKEAAPGPPDEPDFSYFIGESLDFSGPGACTNVDLNEVTKTLSQALDDQGWTGQRFVNGASWAEDYVDAQLFPNSGSDDQFADAVAVTVYAGHGSVNQWQWGQASGFGTCVLPLSTGVRLGSLAGDRAVAVLSLASCTGMASQFWTNFGQTSRVRQVLGYHNSPAIWSDQPRSFFQATLGGMSNRRAWLSVMGGRPGWGHNSPSLLTVGATPEDASAYHAAARLADLTGLSAPPEDAEAYVLSYLNYGCGPCGCPSSSLEPDVWQDVASSAEQLADASLAIGSILPVLKMSRRKRTPAELAERIRGVLDVAGVGAVMEPNLTQWAGRALDSWYETTVLEVEASPKTTWVLYTPSNDDLLVVIDDVGHADEEIDASLGLLLFEGLVEALESRDLATDLDDMDSRIGTMITERAVSGEVVAKYVDGWQYAASRVVAGVPILDAGLTAVIRPDGRVAMIRVTDVAIEQVGFETFAPSPAAVEGAWLDAVKQQNDAQRVYLDVQRIAYALDPDELEAVVQPRLVVNYSLGFEYEEQVIPSRQGIMALSMQPNVPAMSLLP